MCIRDRRQTALKCITGDASSKKVKALTKKIQLQLGSTLFHGGERNTGAKLLTQLLQEDMDDQAALQAYGEAALELGQVRDALTQPQSAITSRYNRAHTREHMREPQL